MELSVNTFLQGGKYRIVSYISSGGFGCTYEAEHVLLGKRVAIKEFFVKDFCNRDERTCQVSVCTESKKDLVEKLRRKFIEEAVALSQLLHQNIVSVHDVFMENGTAYYVMDYIDGQSLHEIVNEHGPLLEQEVLKYTKQIIDALKYIHSHHRLHLDIKPGNIMVDKIGNIKLIDFGASKQYDEVNGENTSTLLGKTPGYAPIEQMGNTVKTFTPATDIYALGATMYKCLTGITPPEATVLMDECLDNFPATISEQTQNAIKKAMEVSKKNRPQNIEEFSSLLFSIAEVSNNVTKHDTIKICDDTTQLSVKFKDTEFNDERMVDLGLSVKWSKYNVGAKRESDIGKYFAWGDITRSLTEASVNSYLSNNTPHSIYGDIKYGMATTIGKGWRLPTKMEQDELRMCCEWQWTTLDGIDGYMVIGINGNSIFLPAAGYREEYDYKEQDFKGCYWSGDLHLYNHNIAYYLNFSDEGRCWMNAPLYMGFSVRLVAE